MWQGKDGGQCCVSNSTTSQQSGNVTEQSVTTVWLVSYSGKCSISIRPSVSTNMPSELPLAVIVNESPGTPSLLYSRTNT